MSRKGMRSPPGTPASDLAAKVARVTEALGTPVDRPAASEDLPGQSPQVPLLPGAGPSLPQGPAAALGPGAAPDVAAMLSNIQVGIGALRDDMGKMRNEMVTKSDLQTMRLEIMQETRLAISQTVDPVKDELSDLRDRMGKLEVAGPSKPSNKYLKMLSAMDPAHRRVSVIGFNDNTSADQRIKVLEAFMAQFPDVPRFETGHFFKGPHDNQRLSKASFIEFSRDDLARSFLARAGGKGKEFTASDGTKLVLKPAKTKVNTERDWALRKAGELVKQAAGDRTVQIDFGRQRCVTVDGSKAFEQQPEDLSGSFVGEFRHLRLP